MPYAPWQIVVAPTFQSPRPSSKASVRSEISVHSGKAELNGLSNEPLDPRDAKLISPRSYFALFRPPSEASLDSGISVRSREAGSEAGEEGETWNPLNEGHHSPALSFLSTGPSAKSSVHSGISDHSGKAKPESTDGLTYEEAWVLRDPERTFPRSSSPSPRPSSKSSRHSAISVHSRKTESVTGPADEAWAPLNMGHEFPVPSSWSPRLPSQTSVSSNRTESRAGRTINDRVYHWQSEDVRDFDMSF